METKLVPSKGSFNTKPSPSPGVKLQACLEAIHGAMLEKRTVETTNSNLREVLGLGWSLVTASQYLTGQTAKSIWVKGFHRGPVGTLTPAQVEVVFAAAHEFCAELNLGQLRK